MRARRLTSGMAPQGTEDGLMSVSQVLSVEGAQTTMPPVPLRHTVLKSTPTSICLGPS